MQGQRTHESARLVDQSKMTSAGSTFVTMTHFLIPWLFLWPCFFLTTQALVTDRAPGTVEWEGLAHGVNLQQEPFRDHLVADNALLYLPRGPACSYTRPLFISPLKACLQGMEGCRRKTHSVWRSPPLPSASFSSQFLGNLVIVNVHLVVTEHH